MKILTKSIHKSKNKEDGVRICVMRHIRPEYDFDIWIPNLAPSEKLLDDYIVKKTIVWIEFKKIYKENILIRNYDLLKLLVLLANHTTITLLCGEDSVRFCHRKLIIEECKKAVIKAVLPVESIEAK